MADADESLQPGKKQLGASCLKLEQFFVLDEALDHGEMYLEGEWPGGDGHLTCGLHLSEPSLHPI